MSKEELRRLQQEMIRIDANLSALSIWLGIQLDSLKDLQKDVETLTSDLTGWIAKERSNEE